MLILHMLCQEGRHNEAAAKLGDLIELVDRFEGKNHNLYYSLSKTFSRVVHSLIRDLGVRVSSIYLHNSRVVTD